jgi:large subunit ribosomal protein L35
MPKMKTHSGAKKRFKLTANGKVKHRAAGMNHINAKLSPERRNRLGGTQYVGPAMEHKIKRLLRVAG